MRLVFRSYFAAVRIRSGVCGFVGKMVGFVTDFLGCEEFALYFK